MPVGEGPSCPHGRPECECLDATLSIHMVPETGQFNGLWREVGSSASNFGPITSGTITGIGTGGSTTPIPNGTITFPANTGLPGAPVSPWASDCSQLGHRITNDRNAIATDEEGTVVGVCEVCMQTVYFPGGLKAFDFERAGVMLGRAIAIDSNDDESVGEMLDELKILEAEMDAQVRRFEAARDLLDLARGVVKKRALRDAACSVDAI